MEPALSGGLATVVFVRHVQCAYCGSQEGQGTPRRAGPEIRICDECIGRCEKILTSEEAARVWSELSPGGLTSGQMRALLEHIENATPLTAGEQIDLFVKWHEQRDVGFQLTLVERNLWLVVVIARSYADREMALLDLVQEGTLGLVRATERFDHRKDLEFVAYAKWWIDEAINRALDQRAPPA